MSRSAQPAFPQPLSELSPNRSKRQRNHTISAAIQMKNQKLHSRTSQKSVVMSSIVISLSESDQAPSDEVLRVFGFEDGDREAEGLRDVGRGLHRPG